MKTTLRNLLLSLSGFLVMAGTLFLHGYLSELLFKFLLLGGCVLFGYGIASIIVEKKTPR